MSGAASIEFALVFPLFFAVLYGIVFFSLLFAAQQMLTLAAAEGARAAIQYATPAQRAQNAQATALELLGAYPPGVTAADIVTSAPCSQCDFTVTVDYPSQRLGLPLLTGLLQAAGAMPVLHGQATARLD